MEDKKKVKKLSDDVFKHLSLELSDSLSRKLKEWVTFYPVKHEKTTYDTIVNQNESPVSISRYSDKLCLYHVDRSVLSKCAALMFTCDDKKFSKFEKISLVEGFFSDYFNRRMTQVLQDDESELKERYDVDDLSKQHIMYPTDKVDLFEFPVQIAGADVGRIKLCVTQQ